MLKTHFEDKILHCCHCNKDILIPFNQVGGYWHLNGWTNKHGRKYWGGYCSPCFDEIHNELPEEGGHCGR